jgi:phosphopantetheinyl transferase
MLKITNYEKGRVVHPRRRRLYATAHRISGIAAVDVWVLEVIDDGPLGVDGARTMLGATATADRRTIEDQRRSVVARAALTQLVALRTRVDPARVRLTNDERGRPLLSGSALHVSIAHSGDFVACAVSTRPVGVDIERSDRSEADDALAKRVCTLAERQALERLLPSSRTGALIRLWTRKEAVVKALGVGGALAFEQLDVSHNAPRIAGARARGLWVRDLRGAPDGYSVALATAGRWQCVRARLVEAGKASATA